MKKALVLLISFVLLAGFSLSISAHETGHDKLKQKEKRAVAYGFAPNFSLTVIHIKTKGGSAAGEDWVVSGFAPGLGYFSWSVPKEDIDIKVAAGRASVNTTGTTPQGVVVQVRVNWEATAGLRQKQMRFEHPSNMRLKYAFKRAAVSGYIGSFTIGQAFGEISKRETRNY